MLENLSQLPAPAKEALNHSNKLLGLIKQEILQQNNVISFARYMELALYAPGLGYYSAGSQKFGKQGDFVTAPEISPLFSRCLARQCQQVLELLEGGDILEVGAGSGVMAADLLLELERLACLPQQYFILEVSAELQQRQQQNLQQLIPHLYNRIHWLSAWPVKPLQGVILANEVLDAMPVHLFALENDDMWELGVAWRDEKLVLEKMVLSDLVFSRSVSQLRTDILSEVSYYQSELNLWLYSWLSSLNKILAKGLILLIDYGFARAEYYHPDRSMGTLMCHYRHYAHSDPFWLPGLQDITAHVDFTAVAEAGYEAGLQVSGYTSQAAFLLACGLLTLAASNKPLVEQLQTSQQIQKLTASHEMGELFKLIALTKEFEQPLIGFSLQDWRIRL